MTDITVDMEFECAECGAALLARSVVLSGYTYIHVGPCDTCLAKAEETGYDKGYDQGTKDMEEVDDD